MKTPYWTAVIEKAKRNKARGMQPFTYSEMNKGNDWVTCACGRQDKRLERYENGEPLDAELARLGGQFSNDLDAQEPADAARTLAAIEKRAAQILRGLKR